MLTTSINLDQYDYMKGNKGWAFRCGKDSWEVYISDNAPFEASTVQAYRSVKPRAFSQEAWQRLEKAGLA